MSLYFSQQQIRTYFCFVFIHACIFYSLYCITKLRLVAEEHLFCIFSTIYLFDIWIVLIIWLRYFCDILRCFYFLEKSKNEKVIRLFWIEMSELKRIETKLHLTRSSTNLKSVISMTLEPKISIFDACVISQGTTVQLQNIY